MSARTHASPQSAIKEATAMPVPTTALRLHVSARPVIDSEPPIERDEPRASDGTPRVIGSLALAAPDRVLDDDAALNPLRPALRLVETLVTRPDRALAHDEYFDVVRTARAELPAPGPRAGVLVSAILEALTGRRPLAQLVRWLTSDVYDELEVSICRDRGRGWAGRTRRLVVSEPADGVAEVTAVVERDQRASAMALRLEGRDGRWVVTALQMA